MSTVPSFDFLTPELLREDLTSRFHAAFGASPEAGAVAPGRVNLIGEHTDYSQGFVLPAAIPLYTGVAVGHGAGGELDVVSSTFGAERMPSQGLEKRGSFSDYVAGAVKLAGMEGLGLRFYIHGDLPAGSGLSSSASLLVALVTALSRLKGEPLEPMAAALLARRVENEFVGVPCGFMDQFAVAMGQEGAALFLDCQDNSFEAIDAELPGAEWLVVYSGLHRKLASGGYAHKVDAVRRAVSVLSLKHDLGEGLLRLVDARELEKLAAQAGLSPEDVALLVHVASENKRVFLMRHALQRKNPEEVGWILRDGHRSLSLDFGVSTPLLDGLVEFAESIPGVLGIRLTGAGMGGSLVALVRSQDCRVAATALQTYLVEHISPEGRVFAIGQPAGGVMGWTQSY